MISKVERVRLTGSKHGRISLLLLIAMVIIINQYDEIVLKNSNSGQIRIGQYMDMAQASRALVHPANIYGVIQVEIGALASKDIFDEFIYVISNQKNQGKPFTNPTLYSHSDAITEAVGALFQAVRQVFPAIQNDVDPRIQFDGNVCYGENSKCRVSASDFIAISGLVGHQHG